MAFGKDRFVAIPGESTSYLLVSTRGTEWQPLPVEFVPPSPSLIRSITFAGGMFLALNLEGQPYASTDGTTWIRQDVPADIQLRAVAGGPGLLVGVGRDNRNEVAGDARRARILRCADGRTWVTNDVQLGNNLHHVAYAGDRFLALGDDGHLLVSADGATWTLVTPSSDLDLEALAEGGSRFVAVGDPARILRSHDGRHWQASQRAPVSSRLNDVAYGAGRFVAVSEDGEVVTSVEGDAWIRIPTEPWPSLKAILHARNRFVAAGEMGFLATSPDGLTWAVSPRGPAHTIRAIASGPDRVVAVGDEAAAVSVRDEDWIWAPQPAGFRVRCVAYGRGIFLASSSTGTSWSSTHGLEWQQIGAAAGLALDDITFAGGRFIASGPEGRIWTSVDGTAWLEHYTGAANRLRDLLVTGNGTLLAAGNNQSVLESGLLLPRLGLWINPRGPRTLQIALPRRGTYRLQGTDALPASAWKDLLKLESSPRDHTVVWEDREPNPARFYRVTEAP